MKIIDLAVVIPTLNEELFIGGLLDSLALQSIQPREIVIVDATSKDTTKAQVLARKKLFSSLSFYSIPKKTISQQRNVGVTKTTAKHLLFLDADMILPKKDSLAKVWSHIQKKRPDVATCYVMPLSDEKTDKFLYGTGNIISTVMKPIKSLGTTMNLYVKRSVFLSLGGFDEHVRVGEDFEFLSRAAKADFSFHVFMRPILYTSVRRLEYEGRIKFILKLARSIFYVKRYGHAKNPIPYTFGHFSKPTSKKIRESSLN